MSVRRNSHLDDVLEAAPARVEDRAHVLEDLTRLRDDVAPPTSRPSPSTATIPETYRNPPADRVREVRDRLGEAVDTELLAAHGPPLSSLSFTEG